MNTINHYAVLGGDLRSAHLASALAMGGDFVYAVGFERYAMPGIVRKCSMAEALSRCNAVILPLPVSRDGNRLFAPYADRDILLDDSLAELLKTKMVFCGMRSSCPGSEAWRAVRMIDYAAEEEFAVRNAVPTAEGALQIAMAESDITLCGARCLVAGYGRIGKVLARLLSAFGARVVVAARKARDLAEIAACGWQAVETDRIRDSGTYQFIFNTVPAAVFDAATLELCAPEAIYIELASAPYGIDFPAAKNLGVTVISAPGLPGKAAPRSAGEIMRQVILRYMRMLR
jgi:dipicolinate synthase subunit A